MKFKEAIQYGLSETRRIREEHQEYRRKHSIQQSSANIVVPSAMAAPLEEPTPSMKRAVRAIIETRLRDAGESYDQEFLDEQEAVRQERTRFRVSKWAVLFPNLKISQRIKLDL